MKKNYIPTINISPLINNNFDNSEAKQIIRKIEKACMNVGFFQIVGHGVNKKIIKDICKTGHKFFKLSNKNKIKLAPKKWNSKNKNIYRGYFPNNVNGKEGLDKVKESKPGLVLLDLMMPEMDGFEFAEKLRENKDWLDIPVVVITAKDLTSEDHNRLKGNVEAIMQKGSYSKKQLLSEVGERIKQLKERS